MVEVVLDSSALIAMLLGEPGADMVEAALFGASMTTVNLAEVAGHYARRGAARTAIEEALQPLPITIVEPDAVAAIDAAMLLPLTRSAGLSLADRFCLTLAKRLECEVLTADRAWSKIAKDVGVRVSLIR